MEMKDVSGATELLISDESGLVLLPLEDYEDLITSQVIVNVFRRLWNDTTRDGDEFEEVFELVFGQRYEEDDDNED